MKRHRFDPFSFVFGVALVALGLYVVLAGSLAEIPSAWAVAIPTLVVATLLVLYAGRRLFDRTARLDDASETSDVERLPDEL
jgi:membrane protein implicated in regulation of membrane protease activity